MNDGNERRGPPTEIAPAGRQLAPIERVQVDNELHTAVQGYVYLIVNDLIRTRVKIGYTTRDPIERAVELVTTGTTGTFVVIYAAMVRNPYAVEQEVHRRLKKHCCGQEWFELCPNRAKEEIFAVAGEVLYENTTPRWHRSQPEPSNETKELLREAKQAAEDKRRREEEEARRARLAAEEARIKREQEAAEAQRLADEEEYRRRAEEQAREAAIEEEEQRLADLRARAFAVAQEKHARRLAYLWHLGRWGMLISAVITTAGVAAYAAWGPYPQQRISVVEARCGELDAEVESLKVARAQSLDVFWSAQRNRRDLAEEQRVLSQSRDEHESKKKIVERMLADRQIKHEEAESRSSLDGRPIPGRKPASRSGADLDATVQSRNLWNTKKAYEDWLERDKALRAGMQTVSRRLKQYEAVAATASQKAGSLAKEIKRKEESLWVLKTTLQQMQSHNARLQWLGIFDSTK